MKKRKSEVRKKFKEAYKKDKKTLIVFILLRTSIILCAIRELMNGNIQNVLLCLLSLILFSLPYAIEKKFKIELPSALEMTVYIFIYSAEILGEINNFYGSIPFWDTILHTLNGFLCASLGFSLVYLLNKKSESIKLSPVFVVLVSFCFSMTIGVAWEIFEYSMDNFIRVDMQKDEIVNSIASVELDPKKDNNTIIIDDISYTIIYDKNDKEIIKIDGYLDIGLKDTMADLIVNFIGAFIYSVFGYLYIKNEEKYKLAGRFITKRA